MYNYIFSIFAECLRHIKKYQIIEVYSFIEKYRLNEKYELIGKYRFVENIGGSKISFCRKNSRMVKKEIL